MSIRFLPLTAAALLVAATPLLAQQCLSVEAEWAGVVGEARGREGVELESLDRFARAYGFRRSTSWSIEERDRFRSSWAYWRDSVASDPACLEIATGELRRILETRRACWRDDAVRFVATGGGEEFARSVVSFAVEEIAGGQPFSATADGSEEFLVTVAGVDADLVVLPEAAPRFDVEISIRSEGWDRGRFEVRVLDRPSGRTVRGAALAVDLDASGFSGAPDPRPWGNPAEAHREQPDRQGRAHHARMDRRGMGRAPERGGVTPRGSRHGGPP